MVDDDPAVRRMLLRVLDEENYSVRTSATGSEGLHLARNETFELLLLDGDLPSINAAEFCAEFTRINPKVPIIIMVRSSEASSSAFNRLGVCLEKPLDIEKLLRTVREALAGSNEPGQRPASAPSTRTPFEQTWNLKPSPIG